MILIYLGLKDVYAFKEKRAHGDGGAICMRYLGDSDFYLLMYSVFVIRLTK